MTGIHIAAAYFDQTQVPLQELAGLKPHRDGRAAPRPFRCADSACRPVSPS